MANEFLISGSLSYSDDANADELLQVLDLIATISTKRYTKAKQSIGFAAEEAINLGEVATPRWAIFINRDSTNFVNIRVGTGGAAFAKLKAGEFALLPLGAGALAPFAIADTAAVMLEYMIFDT